MMARPLERYQETEDAALEGGELRPRVLVVGSADFCWQIRQLAGASGRVVVAAATLEEARKTAFSLTGSNGKGYDEVVIEGTFEELAEVPSEARRAPTRVRVWWEPLEAQLGGRPDFFGDPIPASGRIFKRFLDLVLAPLLLLLTAPILLASAIAIRLNSQGSTIFRQLRLGQDGRPFVLYKFRTMAQNNDDGEHRRYMASLIKGAGEPEAGENGQMHKLVSDRRITPVGRVLRHFSIDELPQLWNVVRGDMTLVGPRPPLPHEVELYDARCWQRMRAKPGLTGLWQVRGRCELDFQRMVDIDIEYWRTWSPLGELAILVRTPWAVLTGRGAA